eukprot:CAMPEP_0206148696 /NCGR_PEP_ID=MMETSP1473-20131121/37384_1 /ASSEMBLY_ACC=CAM_ASM_001109 /TAXON_ID=1461547 /ORGANISM="Stichococcus sp, Strain RCC1054" /LENGTH=329 /DNA_ID=CAMNT_0053546117 /DNA_START=2838 /DNA_END=3827 /DNA_ORIENTATION=-
MSLAAQMPCGGRCTVLARTGLRCRPAFRSGALLRHIRQEGQPAARERCIVYAKGKKGKGSKKKEASVISTHLAQNAREPWQDPELLMENMIMLESYCRSVGRGIMKDTIEFDELAETLYKAPFAILAHDTSDSPVYTYANKAAQDLFEGSWDEIVGKESRSSAEEQEQEARQRLLDETAEKGCCVGFDAWRKSLKGTRFQIKGAILWDILSPAGKRMGQAVRITQWQYEDGRLAGPDAPVSEADVAAAEEAVTQQADAVRALKEEGGLPNSDPKVQAGVDRLLHLKAEAARLQEAHSSGASLWQDSTDVIAPQAQQSEADFEAEWEKVD